MLGMRVGVRECLSKCECECVCVCVCARACMHDGLDGHVRVCHSTVLGHYSVRGCFGRSDLGLVWQGIG